ncbi:MAG: DUF433 domain-containing protein [Pseudomonadota bacterium]
MVARASVKKAKYPYIVSKKGIRGGSPVIEGTGIQVMDIAVRYHLLENTTDEIIAVYPDLTLSQVHDALSYYYDHKEEMDRHWRESLEKVEEMRKRHKSVLEGKLGKVKDLYR